MGGNFAFFTELPSLAEPLGFPIAEVDADGSSVITKHPGAGGQVTVETVTAQLLYEIGPPAYPNPDVVTRFDTVRLEQVGPDRVRISGTRGEPAPPTTKVALNYEGGYRNRMTFVLTGLEQEAKAAWVADAVVQSMGGAERLRQHGVRLETRFVPAPSDGPDQEQSSGRLHVFASAADEREVGRAFSSAAIELALANIPGLLRHDDARGGAGVRRVLAGPRAGGGDRPGRRAWTTGGASGSIPPPAGGDAGDPIEPPTVVAAPAAIEAGQPLGRWFGARSGDKGGNANVGIWARDDAGYAWLAANLTADRVRRAAPRGP